MHLFIAAQTTPSTSNTHLKVHSHSLIHPLSSSPKMYVSVPVASPTVQTTRVINNTPSITLCTQMGRQVEGWWRTARCVVLHPIIQIRVWSSDSAPSTFTLLLHTICILQISFHCCWCHLSLQSGLKTPLKNELGESFTLVFEWFMVCFVLIGFCFYSVLLEEYTSLQSCQSKPHWIVLYITVCSQSSWDRSLGHS